MKIFYKIKNFEDKVNFVDKRNVFVGYDMHNQCCEYYGWFISHNQKLRCNPKDITNKVEEDIDLTDYTFNTSFFVKLSYQDYDYENVVVFQLVNDKQEKLYLHLVNLHNGYYSHGFESKIKNRNWEKGVL